MKLIIRGERDDRRGSKFINFVIESGYKDEPELDEDGQPILRRTTPLHHAVRLSGLEDESESDNEDHQLLRRPTIPVRMTKYLLDLTIRKLFRDVYNRYDANYIDENGWTHFHVACRFGFRSIVQKFLEVGQDPNCHGRKSVDPPIHLTLNDCKINLAKLLLSHGADPNSINSTGLTPLLRICMMVDVNRSDSADLVKMLLEPSSDEYEPVQVDARDSMGNTPLLLALSQGNKEVAEVLLLRGGADPNLIYGSGGLTLLHIIGKRYLDDDFLEQLFNVCDDIHKMVPIDVFNNYGETPLTLVLLEHNEAKAELLLRRGANPNIVNTKGSTLLHTLSARKTETTNRPRFYSKSATTSIRRCSSTPRTMTVTHHCSWPCRIFCPIPSKYS
ncbi:unnamed protein product [Trichogramma brassicae]|uniref:Uncharacterized protein n=1 Tax=Trichogramma brassicae TaxID=86971 RepID=A0A6H5J2A9_9HYME|nr:unnamed protein product [Trichogramma brassicae]